MLIRGQHGGWFGVVVGLTVLVSSKKVSARQVRLIFKKIMLKHNKNT